MLFVGWDVTVAENEDGKTKAKGGRFRMIHTEHSAAWDAKNRLGLPAKIQAKSPEGAWALLRPYIIGEAGHVADAPTTPAAVTDTAQDALIEAEAALKPVAEKAGLTLDRIRDYFDWHGVEWTVKTLKATVKKIDGLKAAIDAEEQAEKTENEQANGKAV
jgi:hypothetical protein